MADPPQQQESHRQNSSPIATIPTLHCWRGTTTPWTLPSNVALAVNPGLDYVEFLTGAERVWLASNATERFPQLTAPRRRAKGRELVGLRYTPPFPYLASAANAFVVLSADFVSADEGTGIVHLAPAFGEDDETVCREAGIAGPQPVLDDGTFAGDITDFAGVSVLEASPHIVSWLTGHDLIFEQSEDLHDYPHCWRCDRPLIYRAVRSWFVRVTALKETLLVENFFTEKDTPFHEALMCFERALAESVSTTPGEFPGIEGDVDLIFRWCPLDELDAVRTAFIESRVSQARFALSSQAGQFYRVRGRSPDLHHAAAS